MYKPIQQSDLYLILHRTREIADRPYFLFVAFILSCLSEVAEPDDEDDEPWDIEKIWGTAIPSKIFFSVYNNAYTQFIEALDNGNQIDIWGKSYSIRHSKNCNKDLLHQIFMFKGMCDGREEVLIERYAILDVTVKQFSFDELRSNKDYLKRVCYLAEDDDDNGWDKLTDMEVVMYLWACFFKDTENGSDIADDGIDRYVNFRAKYKEFLYTTRKEEQECWNTKAQEKEFANSIYLFNADSVQRWNVKHKQKSVISEVDKEEAQQYWEQTFFLPF